MLIIAGSLVLLSILHYALVTSRQGWISAEAIAVLSMMGMMFGYLLRPLDASDEPFIQFSAICYAFCILGMLVVAALKRPQPRHERPIPPELRKPGTIMVLALLVSGALIVAYFALAGSVPLVAGLQNVFLGSENDIRTLRLSTYKGGQYLAPGYVNQVKNVIFPALAAVAIAYLWATRRATARLAALGLGLAVIVALFGTGQRTFGVIFALVIVGAYAMVVGGLSRQVAVRAGVLFLVVFVLATAALGRSAAQLSEASGLVQTVAVYVGDALGRFTDDQQASAILAERVVGGWRIPLLSDWWSGLISYLPGQSGSGSLSGWVGAYYTGGPATTMPPSSVTSARLNLSTVGAVVFFFLWGMVLALVSRMLLAPRGGAPLYFIGSAGIMVVMGTWIADSPFYQLQNGLVAFVILAWVGRRQYTRYLAQQESDEAKPVTSARGRPGGRPRPVPTGSSR